MRKNPEDELDAVLYAISTRTTASDMIELMNTMHHGCSVSPGLQCLAKHNDDYVISLCTLGHNDKIMMGSSSSYCVSAEEYNILCLHGITIVHERN